MVESADFRNWPALRDNELLTAMERGGFTTPNPVTIDKRMAAQQPHAPMAIIAVDDDRDSGLHGQVCGLIPR